MTGDEVRKRGVFAILNEDRGKSFGAGVCVSPDGYIVTCFHVMRAAGYSGIGETAQISNGTEIRQAVWEDANKAGDVALLRTIGKPEQHFYIHNPAENEERFLIGQKVACWGYPNGTQTLSPAGNATIIADWHTVQESRRRGRKEYELDNANGVAPGYSGGPIFWQNDLLVGILDENPRSVNGRAVNKSFGIPIGHIRLDMPKYAERLSWKSVLPEGHDDTPTRGTLGNLEWILHSDGRLIVEGWGTMPGDFPSDWDAVKRKVRSIDVCGNITDISDSAFRTCPLLKSLRVSSSVTRIGVNAFAECPMLESTRLSDRTEAIGDWGFADCVSLSEIRLPVNIKKIGLSAFENCRSLKRIRIPQSVSELDIRTFANCESLEEIELLYGIRQIRREAFFGCFRLRSVRMPDSVRKIGFHAFYNTGLTALEIPFNAELEGDIIKGTVLRRCNPLTRTVSASESLSPIG